MENSYYLHQPGTLTKGSVLDVGLKCTHSCRFCYYSFLDGSTEQFRGMRRAAFRSLDDCLEILRRLRRGGAVHVDITGGEPTLHPQLTEMIRYAATELGLATRVITLGQMLDRKLPWCKGATLLDDLLGAGITNFLFSLHAVNEDLFSKITGESFAKLRRAMQRIDELGTFDYTTNSTVFEWNLEHLPDIAREIIRHRVYLHNFIVMNAYYAWNEEERVFGIQPRFSDAYPYLKEAVRILESSGVAVNIRYAPLCVFPELQRHIVGVVGVRYDPYEWFNLGGHLGGSPELSATLVDVVEGGTDPEYELVRTLPWLTRNRLASGHRIFARRESKVLVEPCSRCPAIEACDGVDPKYVTQYGTGELRPLAEPSIQGRLLQSRRAYSPAFLVKLRPDAPMCDSVRDWFRSSKLPQPPRRPEEIPTPKQTEQRALAAVGTAASPRAVSQRCRRRIRQATRSWKRSLANGGLALLARLWRPGIR